MPRWRFHSGGLVSGLLYLQRRQRKVIDFSNDTAIERSSQCSSESGTHTRLLNLSTETRNFSSRVSVDTPLSAPLSTARTETAGEQPRRQKLVTSKENCHFPATTDGYATRNAFNYCPCKKAGLFVIHRADHADAAPGLMTGDSKESSPRDPVVVVKESLLSAGISLEAMESLWNDDALASPEASGTAA